MKIQSQKMLFYNITSLPVEISWDKTCISFQVGTLFELTVFLPLINNNWVLGMMMIMDKQYKARIIMNIKSPKLFITSW